MYLYSLCLRQSNEQSLHFNITQYCSEGRNHRDLLLCVQVGVQILYYFCFMVKQWSLFSHYVNKINIFDGTCLKISQICILRRWPSVSYWITLFWKCLESSAVKSNTNKDKISDVLILYQQTIWCTEWSQNWSVTQVRMTTAEIVQESVTLIKFNNMWSFCISTSLPFYWPAPRPSASHSPSQEILFNQSNQSVISDFYRRG